MATEPKNEQGPLIEYAYRPDRQACVRAFMYILSLKPEQNKAADATGSHEGRGNPERAERGVASGPSS